MKQKPAPTAESKCSASDIRHLCGDIADWKVSAILALAPTGSEVELAVAFADHQDEARHQRALDGKSAEIFDILTAGEEEDER